MEIITKNGVSHMEKDPVVFVFKDDSELNNFMAKLAATSVKTSGLRVLPMVPENKILTPLQESLLDILNNLDGIGGKDEKYTDKTIANTVEKLRNLIINT